MFIIILVNNISEKTWFLAAHINFSQRFLWHIDDKETVSGAGKKYGIADPERLSQIRYFTSPIQDR